MERMPYPQPESTEPQSEELLKQLQSVETRKFLINACRKKFNNLPEADIEDIIQTTFTKAAKAILKGGYRGESSLTTWLYRIAHNAAIDVIEAQKRFKKTADDFTLSTTDRTGQTAEDFAIETEEIITLQSNIKKLPPKYRTVIEMTIGGKKIIEIAKDLNINIDTIKSHIRRAKQLLRKMAYGKQNNKNIPE